MERMSETANTLERIERGMGELHARLFGPEPTDRDACAEVSILSVRSLADSAYYSATRLERILHEIYNRLVD